ncbi:MAG: hypothetical protein Fur0044_11450 [Anaerolineae bacterium]|nr:hypothetical protein [Anaerolineales bacterium]MCQ3977884.1 hypothetical protein [Anaerolineae bacterium]
MNLVSSILTIYIWAVVCILLFFLFAIGRFYQKKSGRRSYYPSFFVSIALFALAAVRYAFLAPTIVGDLGGDILRFLGGLVVGGFGLFLLRLMIGGRS